MTTTTAFLCIITLNLVTIPIPSQITAASGSASGSDGGAAFSGSPETGKPSTPRKADHNVTGRGTPSAGQPKQIPAPPDRSQAVEERLRSGQMEKPIAQGEISERLNQLYSGSNSVTGETAAEHSSR